ncbi:MAG: hypothetical protein ACF8SC_05890 [Phycisphaerales bacterium JB037]
MTLPTGRTERGAGDPRDARPGPRTQREVADAYFMEHRAKVIDLAAFLDRFDRAAGDGGDLRVEALRDAVRILLQDGPGRARRVLEHFSDPTAEPIERSPGKGACGAWLGEGGSGPSAGDEGERDR